MARYSSQEAMEELKDLESRLLPKTESLLKEKNAKNVTSIIFSIDNETYKTEREARRLRLTGKLDYKIYRTLIKGYVELQKQIIELSEKHDLGRDVSNMYSFLRIEASMANRKAKI